MKTVTSSPENLLWYHKFLMAFGTVVLLGVLYFGYYAIKISDFRSALTVPLYSGLWFFYIYPMFTRQKVVEYDESSIFTLHTFKAQFSTPFPYSFITRAVRSSPYALRLHFAETSDLQFTVHGSAVKLAETVVNGNETDLNQFSEMLTKNHVSVELDPIPDNDPMKQVAILIAALLGIVVFMAGTLHLAKLIH